ncbi:MAG: shikimate kinase [Pseudomonadota bacterium]|nr:shikimate kinase [Pseudomonadota bacterium]
MNFSISNLIHSKKNIVLVGFMGSGKTSIGRALAKKLNYLHIDTDKVIEKEKNMNISNIFDFYGENYFRELEQDIIIKIINNNIKSVISLGGGSFLNIKIRENIQKLCISVWLNADIDIIYDRISNSKNIRPVLSKLKNKSDLESLLNKRNLIYKEADIKIDINNLSKNSLIEKVFQDLRFNN